MVGFQPQSLGRDRTRQGDLHRCALPNLPRCCCFSRENQVQVNQKLPVIPLPRSALLVGVLPWQLGGGQQGRKRRLPLAPVGAGQAINHGGLKLPKGARDQSREAGAIEVDLPGRKQLEFAGQLALQGVQGRLGLQRSDQFQI